jgi:hypothetical protein
VGVRYYENLRMAEITLSEYTGYLYLEMIKAREMADSYSKSVALRYEQDPVLKHFPTPRFKVPKITLSIPMLVAGARFSQVEHFNMKFDEFSAFLLERLDNALKGLTSDEPKRVSKVASRSLGAVVRKKRGAASLGFMFPVSGEVMQLVKSFHSGLMGAGASVPTTFVRNMWEKIFQVALVENKLVEAYKRRYPTNQLFEEVLSEVAKAIRSRTTIDGVKIQNLLINPETSIVKDGASGTSVFTVLAEMTEDGFFLKSVKDADGVESKIVEFE